MSPESRDLVRAGETRVADAYERQFMTGEGVVLYRYKQRAPWLMTAMLGGTSLVIVLAGLASGTWLGMAFGLPLVALSWLMFSVLRVTVSSGMVSVQYGIFGPQIPVAAIERVEATTYDWKRFGGWGIRRARGEDLYNMPGDGGHAVRIVWHDSKGRRKVTLIGSSHADQLASTIRGARAALPGGEPRAALESGED